jgi:hypothetical protein
VQQHRSAASGVGVDQVLAHVAAEEQPKNGDTADTGDTGAV